MASFALCRRSRFWGFRSDRWPLRQVALEFQLPFATEAVSLVYPSVRRRWGGLRPKGRGGGRTSSRASGRLRTHKGSSLSVSRPVTMQASLTRDLQRALRADKFAHF